MNDMPPRSKSTIDRRIARTRAGLQHALVTLIMQKGYDAATVEDICRQANVGRSTFYLHYAGKDALKRSGLEHLRDELAERQKHLRAEADEAADGLFGFSQALFEHAHDHIDLYRALAGGRGSEVSLDGIRTILSGLVRDNLAKTGNAGEPIPREIAVQYVVGAYMAVLTWWLDRGAKPSPQKMGEMLGDLTANGIARRRN